MSVRESIAERKGLVVVTAIVLVITAVITFAVRMKSGDAATSGGGEVWFTDDDGKTWFATTADKLSPFDHNGKPAYRCYVFSCDGGKTKFVSHLERLPPEVHRKLTSGVFDPMARAGVEVKDPGASESAWVRQADPRAKDITTPTCPNDPSKLGEPVSP